MSLPFYSANGSGGSFLETIRSVAKREINKAKAKFWTVTSGVLNKVDEKVAQPALKVRNSAVEGITTVGESITGGLKIGTALVVVLVVLVGFLYIRSVLPRGK